MKKLLFVLMLVSSVAFAHVERSDPVPNGSIQPPQAQQPTCYQVGAREAWGGYARLAGAPLKFIYVPYDVVFTMFSKTKTSGDIPSDGIYVWETLDEDQRANYEGAATHGWMEVDSTLKSGADVMQAKQTTLEELTAIFLEKCGS